MSEASLYVLEREVEAARAKLADDLSTLRSPSTYSEFTSGIKGEALDLKDVLVDQAKSSVQSTLENFVEDMKARAAANPAAALTIGAGIAWRLFRHPPIATTLIGAGLYSLLRTTPLEVAPVDNESFLARARERLAEQTGQLAGHVRQSATAMGQAAADKATEMAADVKTRAASLGEAATDKAAELADLVKPEVFDSGAQEAQATAYGPASEQWAGATSRASAMAEDYSRAVRDAVVNHRSREQLLLGAASLAVVAALGIACQRRLNAEAEAD